MARKISLALGKQIREFEVIEQPYPHILIESMDEAIWHGKQQAIPRLIGNEKKSLKALECLQQ